MPRARVKTNVIFTLDRLPLVVLAGLAGFSAVAVLLLLAGWFYAWLIWPLGLLAAAGCAWPVFRLKEYQRPGSKKAWVICDALVLAGVVLWGGWNIFYTSQHIVTDRDPATYAVTAGWLAEHNSFTEEAPDTFAGMGQLSGRSAGFMEKTADGQVVLHPQGQHLLPALLGSVGKVVGPKHALRLNVLFGMTALLAIYCFGRLLMRPGWALLATAAVALSFPLLYHARDTYTEPLTLTFTFGGLAFLWLAQQTGRRLLWALAGLLFGAGVLTRIDGYLALVGIAAFFVAYLALSSKKQGTGRLKDAAAFWLPAAAMSALAWLDLKLYSEAYYQYSRQLMAYEVTALVAVLAAGFAAYGITRKYGGALPWLGRQTAKWRAWAALALVLAAGAFFASRPLWWQPLGDHSNGIITSIQKAHGNEVEPRTYTELATYWVSWYIGPLLAALGLVGLAAASYKGMRDKKMLLLPALAVILGSCLVYFTAPNITPDQPWASRRMLPVILPGVAIFGAYALALMYGRVKFTSRAVKGAGVAAVCAAVLTAPLATSAPFLAVSLKTQYPMAGNACAALPDNAAVVMIGMARLNMVQPVKTYCGVDTYDYDGSSDKPAKDDLKRIAKAAREDAKLPVLGVYRSQYGGLIDEKEWPRMTEMPRTEYVDIVRTVEAAPSEIKVAEEHLSLAVINSDGSLAPLPKR